MENTVMAKPTPFCTVKAVPVYWGGQYLAAKAENWGESETTKKPQIITSVTMNPAFSS